MALCLSLSPYQTLCQKPFFVNGYVVEGKCINVAQLCLHPLSKNFDFRWTRFREFEPKKEGRRINTVRDSSHLFSFILVHHIKAPEISPRGFLSRKHPHTRGKDFLKDSLVSQSFRMLSMSTS